MTFFEEMADLVAELLDPEDDDSFGEAIVFTRAQGGYDKDTRKATPTAAKTQTLAGSLNTKLSNVAIPGGLIAKYDGVIIASPRPISGDEFVPGVGDRATVAGVSYSVEETAHVKKRGIAIAYMCGVKTA